MWLVENAIAFKKYALIWFGHGWAKVVNRWFQMQPYPKRPKPALWKTGTFKTQVKTCYKPQMNIIELLCIIYIHQTLFAVDEIELKFGDLVRACLVPAMGRPLDGQLINKYAAEFARHPVLKSRGFSLLVNMSGKLFVNKRPSRRDVDANTEVEKKNKRTHISETYVQPTNFFCSVVHAAWLQLKHISPEGDWSSNDDLERKGKILSSLYQTSCLEVLYQVQVVPEGHVLWNGLRWQMGTSHGTNYPATGDMAVCWLKLAPNNGWKSLGHKPEQIIIQYN